MPPTEAERRRARRTLRRARAILADPAAWTKGRVADTGPDHGAKPIDPADPAAARFCAIGAVAAAAAGDYRRSNEARWYLSMAAARQIYPADPRPDDEVSVSIGGWNDRDTTTHADILAAFDAAIRNLEN